MMLDKTRSENLNARFQETIQTLDRAIRRAQLVRKINLKTQQSVNASPEDLVQILADLKSYKKLMAKLDQG